jgi:hypothetical protein
MAMFQQPVRTPGTTHVEFRAGICEYDGVRKVTPDKRKGRLVLLTEESEQLMHVQWIDREKNEIVHDIIVINDVYLERIDKCKTGKTINGRVYLLRFTSNKRKIFFWMQEPDESMDAERIKKFNETVGAKVPESKNAPVSGSVASAAPIDPALQAVLNQFLAAQGQAGTSKPPVTLGVVLTTEVLQSLMTDEKAVEEMKALLPEGQQSAEDLRETLASPQVQQSLTGLTQAVHSEQLSVLFASLGLDATSIGQAAAGTDALEIFCKAMEDKLGEASVPEPKDHEAGGP